MLIRPFLQLVLLLALCVFEWRSAQAATVDSARQKFFAGELAEARVELEELIAGGEQTPVVYLYLGVILRGSKQWANAARALQAAIELAPDKPEYRLELATTHAWAGRLGQSLQTYERIVERWPSNRAARLGQARVLGWQGQHERSVSLYLRYLAAFPDDVEGLLGLAFVKRGRLESSEARKLYQKVLRISRGNVEAKQGLAALERQRRCELLGSVGAVRFAGGSDRRSLNVRGSCLVSPEVKPFLAYQANLPAGLVEQLALADSGVTHVAEVGAAYRATEALTMEAGYRTLRLPQGNTHQMPLRLTLKLDERWVALGGARPGLLASGAADLLADLGLQRGMGVGGWLMLQNFTYVSTEGSWAITGVGSGFASLTSWLSVKAGGGGGLAGAAAYEVAFGELGIKLFEEGQMALLYEGLWGHTERHALSLAAKRSF